VSAAFAIVHPDEQPRITRPHEPDEPPRHVTEITEAAGLTQARANVWRYEPGAAGRRHRHPSQEEVFVVLEGTLSAYLGDPAERHDVPAGSVLRLPPATVIQSVNHGTTDLRVYVHGWPPEDEHAELLDSAV
jgi:quercetin dioxygenase-like cupin family protein